MRLFVAGIPPGVSEEEVRARFTSVGGTVSVELPAKRRLGNDILNRGFLHVDISGVENAAVRRLASAVCSSRGCAALHFTLSWHLGNIRDCVKMQSVPGHFIEMYVSDMLL